jgi:hypothetical protein
MVSRLPALADQVLAGIPRLEDVRAAIHDQDTPFGDEEDTSGNPPGEQLPLGARVLRIVRDYDALASAGRSSGDALGAMRSRPGTYDPRLLAALASALVDENQRELVTRPVDKLEPGMVLADAVYTESGVKLVPAGQEITISLLERIRNFSRMASGVREPIRVLTGTGLPGGGS